MADDGYVIVGQTAQKERFRLTRDGIGLLDATRVVVRLNRDHKNTPTGNPVALGPDGEHVSIPWAYFYATPTGKAKIYDRLPCVMPNSVFPSVDDAISELASVSAVKRQHGGYYRVLFPERSYRGKLGLLDSLGFLVGERETVISTNLLVGRPW